MIFSSSLFLFLFLPICGLTYFALPSQLRNGWLLLASLFFYWWGSGWVIAILLLSIAIDYFIARAQTVALLRGHKRALLTTSILLNLGLLFYFKYYSFFIANVNALNHTLGLQSWTIAQALLPIGISFYTFQTISYQVDVYRGTVSPQRSLVDFALFVSLFPQLIAGPIVRYTEIAPELTHRTHNQSWILSGIGRFIVGLGSKVLIADPLGVLVHWCFNIPHTEVTTLIAWLGCVGFALQVYFDFSAYSDMAIGLGRVFGFRFPENFNYPFISTSLGAFWQRWHMTLMRWLRDYLYPLLRQLPGGSQARTRNILLIFTLCGLWHGANWTFILWGFLHGLLIVIERAIPRRVRGKLPMALQRLYPVTLFAMSGCLFRAHDLTHAWVMAKALVGYSEASSLPRGFFVVVTEEQLVRMAIAAIATLPLWPLLQKQMRSLSLSALSTRWRRAVTTLQWCSLTLTLASILLYSIATISLHDQPPFVYFQF